MFSWCRIIFPHGDIKSSTDSQSVLRGSLMQTWGLLAVLVLVGTLQADEALKETLPDEGRTPETIVEVPVRAIDPPEKVFFAKRLDYRGLPIRGAAVVSDAAFYERVPRTRVRG